MKWIKASDRFPDDWESKIFRYISTKQVLDNNLYEHKMDALCKVDSFVRYGYLSLEWLDESLPGSAGMREALIKIRDLTAADVSDPLKALNHMQIIARDALIEQIEEIDFEQALSSTGEEKWVSEKPKEWQQCILLTATWDKRQKQWEFNSYYVVYIEGVNDKEEAAWYWALCDINGEEWDDINDLKADLYQMIELPSPSKPQQK